MNKKLIILPAVVMATILVIGMATTISTPYIAHAQRGSSHHNHGGTTIHQTGNVGSGVTGAVATTGGHATNNGGVNGGTNNDNTGIGAIGTVTTNNDNN
jgi:hypothetical protein